MKAMDADVQTVIGSDINFGTSTVKTLEVKTVTNRVPLFMVMAIGQVGDQLVSIQVAGPQKEADETRARAKAIFDSVTVAAK
jgi:hypothetical protein